MMSPSRTRMPMRLGLCLTAATLLAAGCGGGGEQSDDATTVTVPDPAHAGNEAAPAPAPKTEGAGKADSPAKPDAGASAPVKADGFGVLKGRVTFAGDAPAPRILVKKGDKDAKDAMANGQPCCAADDITAQDLVVDGETRGVRYALVYLPRPTAVKPDAAEAARAASLELRQKGCTFQPHVLAAMAGATIQVTSNDPVSHNVNFLLTNTKFNQNMAPGSAPTTVKLEAAEARPREIVCDIHTWMKSWLLVSNNPYFAVTNAKGEYTIKDVPAGTQKVVVWQEAVAPSGFVTPSAGDDVVIPTDGEAIRDFTIQASQLKK